jgi:hypothetical protein
MALLNTAIGPERVQSFAVPIGTVQLAGAATSITAFLISTTQVGAPVNSPTAVTDLTSFVSVFGGPDEISYDAYYAVEGYYNNAGTGATAIIVNVGTSPTANSFIGNATVGSGLRALDAIDDIGLVCIPGLPLSMAWEVQPALIDYSLVVRAEFGANLSTTFSLLSVPKEISTASNDVLLTNSPTFTSVAGSGPYVITFSGTLPVTVVPGTLLKNASASFQSTISAVSGSTVTIITNPASTFTSGDMLYFYMPSAVNYKNVVVNTPSRVAAWYYNSVVVSDEGSAALPGAVKSVDPIGHVAGVIGRIDANIAIGGVSHAPAGIQYAGISGILGLNLAISERMDAAPLRLAFVNRITSFPSSGNVIFGAYTDAGSSATAEEQLVQVMRALQFIKGSLDKGLRGFLWENFSPNTQAQIEQSILSFLRNNSYLFPAGLPEAQQFKVISIVPTQDELDQGLLRVRIQVKPNTAVRFIEIALEFPLPTA